MGFVKAPTKLGLTVRHYLIIGKPEGQTWSIGEGDLIKSCPHQAIEGRLVGIQFREDSTYGSTRMLIYLEDLETGELDCITSGFRSKSGDDTCFARCFCLALDVGFDFTKPIVIVPNKGKTSSKAVFCSVYQGGERIQYEWKKEIDCLKVLEELCVSFSIPLYPPSEEENTTNSESKQPQVTHDFNSMIQEQNGWLKKLNISTGQASDYLLQTYGKKSRHLLSDDQFIEFHNYLENQFLEKSKIPF